MNKTKNTEAGVASATGKDPILKVRNLVKYFPIERGVLFKKTIGQIKAVDDVSFDLHKGETLGLVGESGCGKSTLAKTLLRLTPVTSGTVEFEGRNIFSMKPNEVRKLRRSVQTIFQDPHASLNPRMTVADIVGEPFDIHSEVLAQGKRRNRVRELMDRVGLDPDFENRYPHQFSGGQRQRIGIARALALNPKIIVCDEPVSALDVSVQAQVVNLLQEIQDDFELSYIFITHDLSVVHHICDRVAVMYMGKIAEIGSKESIYKRTSHPYTEALLSAVPVPDPLLRRQREKIILTGDVPSPSEPPSGCRFRTRCWKAEETCSSKEPVLMESSNVGHYTACHFPSQTDSTSFT